MRACIVGPAARPPGTEGVVRRDTLQGPQLLGSGQERKQLFTYQLFVPFCCPTPFKYFDSDETFKQKQKTEIPQEPN